MEMNDNTSPYAGYVAREDAASLVDQMVQHCRRSGAMPAVVVSQSLAQDVEATLENLALRLYNKGLLSGAKVHTYSLLTLLSAREQDLRSYLQQIRQMAARNDGLVCLNDCYRYLYDPKLAYDVIGWLCRNFRELRAHGPLVLVLPVPDDRKVLEKCPDLRKDCFHLTDRPLTFQQSAVSQSSCSPGEAAPREPARSEASRRVEQDPVEILKRNGVWPGAQPARSNSQRPVLWYQQNPGLWKKEFNGLYSYLKSRGIWYEMTEPGIYSNSGRMRIQVQVEFNNLGPCLLSVVYSDGFQKGRTDLVGVSARFTSHNPQPLALSHVRSTADQEVGGYLFYPAVDWVIEKKYGSAAAALDGFLRLLMQ